MVAYTPNLLLPYQRGGDAPCDADDVWCELTRLLDTAVDGVDEILSRLTPAIPAARVRQTVPVSIDPVMFHALITFGAVDYDTDGMVDLATNPTRIVPRRSGSYLITGKCSFSGGTSTEPVDLIIVSGLVAGGSIGGQMNDVLRTPIASTSYMRNAMMSEVGDPGSFFGWGLVFTNFTGTVTVSDADLSVYWINDLV